MRYICILNFGPISCDPSTSLSGREPTNTVQQIEQTILMEESPESASANHYRPRYLSWIVLSKIEFFTDGSKFGEEVGVGIYISSHIKWISRL